MAYTFTCPDCGHSEESRLRLQLESMWYSHQKETGHRAGEIVVTE